MAGLSTAGLLQYLYYFIYDIDYHLSLLCVPLILLITLWISITQDSVSARGFPKFSRWIFGGSVIISLWMCMVITSPWFFSGIRNSLIYKLAMDFPSGERLTFTDPYRFRPSNSTVSDLVTLTEKYAPDDRAIAVFAFPDDQTEALLLMGKTHILGLTDPVMCGFSPSYSSYVLSLAEKYAGVTELIFYDSSEGILLDLQKEAFQLLTSRGRYLIVDRMGAILVFRRE